MLIDPRTRGCSSYSQTTPPSALAMRSDGERAVAAVRLENASDTRGNSTLTRRFELPLAPTAASANGAKSLPRAIRFVALSWD